MSERTKDKVVGVGAIETALMFRHGSIAAQYLFAIVGVVE